MKQEKIFEALSGVGDDLLELAQNRRFVNHWKRWGRTVACLALVLCLTALALPYFPIGCGSSTGTVAPEAAPEAPAEMPEMEEMKQETAAAEEAPAAKAPMEDAMAKPETEGAKNNAAPMEAITVWMGGIAYELLPGVKAIPEDLGKELGEVEQSDGRELTGCRVFAALESGGIYVEVPEGYLLGEMTDR